MTHHIVLRVVAKLVLPLIFLFALYVQFHGDYGPGGGFQAGVLFAAGFILYALVFGVKAAKQVVPESLLRALMAVGVLVYTGTGLATVFLGYSFLDYRALADTQVKGEHLGIMLVELGVGVTVAAVMVSVFLAFASRARSA